LTVKNDFSTLFRSTHSKMSRLYTRVLSRLDLSLPQYAILNLLSAQDSMSMTQISRALGITKPAVTNLVDRLENRKLVRRVADTKDRRVSRLAISAKAKGIVQAIQGQTIGLCENAFEKLSASEARTMVRFHEILTLSIDRKLSEKNP